MLGNMNDILKAVVYFIIINLTVFIIIFLLSVSIIIENKNLIKFGDIIKFLMNISTLKIINIISAFWRYSLMITIILFGVCLIFGVIANRYN